MDFNIHTEAPVVIQLMDFFIDIQRVGTVSVQLVDIFIHTQWEPGRYTTDVYFYSHDRRDDRYTFDGLFITNTHKASGAYHLQLTDCFAHTEGTLTVQMMDAKTGFTERLRVPSSNQFLIH